MKKKIKILFSLITILLLTGCYNNFNDSVKVACKYTIRDLNNYLDGKIDTKELSNNMDEYADNCSPTGGNSKENYICVEVTNISTSAYFDSINNKKEYGKYEDHLKYIKKLCK